MKLQFLKFLTHLSLLTSRLRLRLGLFCERQRMPVTMMKNTMLASTRARMYMYKYTHRERLPGKRYCICQPSVVFS